MKLNNILPVFVFIACGNHAGLRASAIEATAQGVTVTVAAEAQENWPADREFCVNVEWKETAKLKLTTTRVNDYFAGSDDEQVPAVDSARQCAKQALKTGATATFNLSPSKALPTAPPLTILAYLTPGADGGSPGIIYDTVIRLPNP